MRLSCLVLTTSLALASANAFAAGINPIGQWELASGESRYAVSHCGKSGQDLCARLVWLREDARTEENVALLNKTVVRGTQADENEWTGTVIYEGKTYEATVTLASASLMKVHSCSGVFCQSFQLHRI